MNKLYVIKDDYSPNSAATNRLLAFVKGFEELGVKTRVVFIRSDNSTKLPIDFGNVSFISLRVDSKIKIKYGNYYLQFILSIYPVLQFVRSLKSNDNVLLFGAMNYLFIFSLFKKINVYHERTEHPKAVRTINRKLYVNKCKKLNGLFVISTHLKDYFSDMGVKKENIHIVNMVVDPNRFKGIPKEIGKERYIAYCGSIGNKKDGVDDLLRAFKIVTEKNSEIKLCLIGKIIRSIEKDEYLNYIKENNLESRIIFTGSISSEDMPKLLINAETLILSRPITIFNFGFPTKLGEYLLTGNPTVITNVGDIDLFLKDKDSTLIAQPGNIRDIANKIEWVLTHPDESKIIGKKGYEVAMKYFNYRTEAQKFIDVIYPNFK
ncbi:MAG: hypothetical protein A2X18_05460 [Bacteroidetes bacterium GWF2_40_14]|nr:MAG: hypothetical protein A2X18_05460 [Bacteroidetes bacterium GWF2_40_14]